MSNKDLYYVLMMVIIQLRYLFLAVYHLFQKDYYKDIALGIHVLNDVVDCIVGLMILVKVIVYRIDFVTTLRQCFESQHSSATKSVRRSELMMFLVFSVLLVARILSRSLGSGEVILVHDFLTSLLYAPTMIFVLMVRNLSCKFSNLNHQLRETFEAAKSHNMPVYDLRTNLNNMFRMHIYLRDVKNSTNSFFGMFNVTTTINRVVYLTVALFYLIMIMCDPAATLEWIDVFVILSVFTAEVVLFDVCYRCSEKVSFVLH